MKRMNIHRTSLLILLLLLAAGCSAGRAEPVQTETPTATRTSVPPSATATATATITLTLTETSIPTPTPVPREQANPIILELLETNGGCRLPCWWGITPGQTTWEEAKAILYPLASEFLWSEIESGISAGAFFEPPPTGELYGLFSVGLRIQDNIIQSVNILELDGVLTYRFSEFLNTYGEPDEIWVYAYPYWPVEDQLNPFVLHLFYPSKGIFAYYADKTGCETRGDNAYCCIDAGPVLGLWSPDRVVNHDEAIELSGLGFDTDRPFVPAKEALGIDTLQFYQTYKNPNQPSCFQTPRQLWRYWATATPKP